MAVSGSKVALLTLMTVSRLELLGAIVGLRLTQSISRTVGLGTKAANFYLDSTDMLWWIPGRGRDFRRSVVNCIGELQIRTEPAQW